MAYKKAFDGMTRTGNEILNGQYKNFHTGEIVRFIDQPARQTVISVQVVKEVRNQFTGETHTRPVTEKWFVYEVNGEYYHTTRVSK